jgi:hypothetical protein
MAVPCSTNVLHWATHRSRHVHHHHSSG